MRSGTFGRVELGAHDLKLLRDVILLHLMERVVVVEVTDLGDFIDRLQIGLGF